MTLVVGAVVVVVSCSSIFVCLCIQISDAVKSSYGRRDDTIVEYVSMQSALYMTCFACALGGAFFLLAALFIDDDRRHTERITQGLYL